MSSFLRSLHKDLERERCMRILLFVDHSRDEMTPASLQYQSEMPPAHFGIMWPSRVRDGNMLVSQPLPWSQLHDIDTLYPYLDRAIIGAFNDASKINRETFRNYNRFIFHAFNNRPGETQKLISWLRQTFATIARLMANALQNTPNRHEFQLKFIEYFTRWESATEKLLGIFMFLNQFLPDPPKSSGCRFAFAYFMQAIWEREIKEPFWQPFLNPAAL